MQSTRQYLRNLSKDTIIKLLKLSNLTENEYWLLKYAFAEKRMRENICEKLHISKTKYHTMMNEALIKVDLTINSLDKVRTL